MPAPDISPGAPAGGFDLSQLSRTGHFQLESGHHTDLWLELELLGLNPGVLRQASAALAEQLSRLNVGVICGPLVEGAFLGLLTALQLNVPFVYTKQFTRPSHQGLFPTEYRIPRLLRSGLRDQRVAIVDDAISAGSATRGTFTALQECGASVVAIGALLVLGNAADVFANTHGIPLLSLSRLPNNLWQPSECPLCAQGITLVRGPGAD